MEWLESNLMLVVTLVVLSWVVWSKLLKPKLAGVESMPAHELKTLKTNAYTLIDVRTKSEWDGGRAVNAIHIPLREVKQRMHEVAKDKPVVCICASGVRSLSAATSLGQAGFSPVYNLSGGMGSYRSAKLPIKK